MKKIIIGKYDKDTYGDHLEYFKEASIELIEAIKTTPNLPLDDIEHNINDWAYIIHMNDLLQDYDDLFTSEKLTSLFEQLNQGRSQMTLLNNLRN